MHFIVQGKNKMNRSRLHAISTRKQGSSRVLSIIGVLYRESAKYGKLHADYKTRENIAYRRPILSSLQFTP